MENHRTHHINPEWESIIFKKSNMKEKSSRVKRQLSTLIVLTILIKSNMAAIDDSSLNSLKIQMPNAKPLAPETYLCTWLKVDSELPKFVVEFEPNATANIAHHLLLFGCEKPGSFANLFNCGSMTVRQPNLPSSAQACEKNSAVIYAWAKNAPKLELPEGVAFRLGHKGYKYIVLQVHYASIKNVPEIGDTSGVLLKYTNVPQPKSAGVLVTASGGRIPAGSTTFMETSCKIREPKVIHPFAFRVHTHDLGTVVSGFKVVNSNQWTLLGKANPQLPQMFYPMGKKHTMTTGDALAVRCTMVNRKSHAVWVGATKEDEMCNFYLMYYVEGDKTLDQQRCFSIGPPIYSWDGWFFGGGLSNVPDKEASSLDNGYFMS